MAFTEHDPFVRLDPIETALCTTLGSLPLELPSDVIGSARTVLDALADEIVSAGPVVVQFSGGRDSSAVLALLDAAARRVGAPAPVPLILRYPGVASADETQWQELVLGHLRISDPLIVTVTDQQRLLGRQTKINLERRGLIWPVVMQSDPALEAVAHLTDLQVVTGEGGDEVLGPRRITPWTVTWRNRRRPSRTALLAMWSTVSGVRRPFGLGAARNRGIPVQPWLRGRALSLMRSEFARLERTRWGYDRATRDMIARRATAVFLHNYQAVAAESEITLHHPLLDPRFLVALGRDGGRWGFRGRTDTMRFLFSDLLPDALLSRSTKAWFNGSRYGEEEREFARTWDGSGVDHELVDPEILREIWLSDEPSSASGPLMHQAWLAANGLPLTGRLASRGAATP